MYHITGRSVAAGIRGIRRLLVNRFDLRIKYERTLPVEVFLDLFTCFDLVTISTFDKRYCDFKFFLTEIWSQHITHKIKDSQALSAKALLACASVRFSCAVCTALRSSFCACEFAAGGG